MKTPLVSAAAVALLLSLPGAAHAQDDSSTVAAARAIGTEGLKLAEAGNCAEAIDKLERAEKLHHAPTTQVRLGECYVQTGRLVLGLEHLRKVARETLPADAPPAFAGAKARAQKVIEDTQGRIAQLHVEVTVPSGAAPEVRIDGDVVPAALLGADRPTDPGSHTVEVTAPGHKRVTQNVLLKDGERKALAFTLEVDVSALPAASSTPAGEPAQPEPIAAETTPAAERRADPMRIAGWTLLAVGGAGLVTGTVAGILGLGTKSSLDDACGNEKQCAPSEQGRLDRLKTESTIGTIGFVVGAVGVASGVTLLLLAPSSKKTEAKTSSPTLRAGFGFGSVTLRGSF